MLGIGFVHKIQDADRIRQIIGRIGKALSGCLSVAFRVGGVEIFVLLANYHGPRIYISREIKKTNVQRKSLFRYKCYIAVCFRQDRTARSHRA